MDSRFLRTGERRHLQPAPALLPRRQNSQSQSNQFSHIQIIPKAESNAGAENQRSPEPVFRKASLMQDTGAEPGSSISQADFKSSDSLANHTQGTTFAAKARAAELQAARARKELKLRLQKPTGPVVTHELMTFKSKGKSARQWKRLDLSSLPDPGEEQNDLSDSRQPDSEVNLSSIATSKNTSSENLPAVYDGSNAYLPTLTEAMQLTARSRLSRSSSPEQIMQSIEHDEPQKDDDVPDRGSSADQVSVKGKEKVMMGPDDIPSGDENLHNYLPRLPPLKRGSSDSHKTVVQTQYAYQPAESVDNQLHQDDLQPRISLPTIEQRSPLPASSEVNSRQASSVYTGGSGDRYFGSHTHSLPGGMPIAYTQPAHIPPLQSKPPHLYPAVKGTQSAGIKFPISIRPTEPAPFSRDDFLPSSSPLPSSYSYSWCGRGQGLDYHIAGPQDGFGKPAHSVSAPLPDPFGSSMPTHTGVAMAPPQPMPHNYDPSKHELYDQSEELPWKNRYVPIHTPAVPSNPEHPFVFDGYDLTVNGPIKIGPSDYPSATYTPPPLDLSHDRCEIKDERFHPGLVPWMHKVIDYTRAANAQQHMAAPHIQHLDPSTRHTADQYALARANFSDDPPRGVMEPYKSMDFVEQERAKVQDLLLPALASLKASASGPDYFNRWGKAPEWSIDHGPDGDRSFFGGDWGAPPQRVGRDPRYAFKGPDVTMMGQRGMGGGFGGNTGPFGTRGFGGAGPPGMGWGGN